MKGPQIEGLDRENLEKLYVNDPKSSLSSVAELLGTHRETVRRWVKAYGLPIKPKSREGARNPETQRLADKEWLRGQLVRKSVIQIARDLGTTDYNVWYWSKKHGLRKDETKSNAIKCALKKQFPEGRYGKDASNWKGGRHSRQGYIVIYMPDHPYATKAGYIMEHRLVVESHLDRYLEPGEVVHHLNGIKDDNRFENLQVVPRGNHVSNHFKASHEVLPMRDEIERLKAEIIELKARLAQYEDLAGEKTCEYE